LSKNCQQFRHTSKNLEKSAQKLFFATMRKKCQPNAEKRDFLLKNVTFCHGKKYW
jgi:hypothetical protein